MWRSALAAILSTIVVGVPSLEGIPAQAHLPAQDPKAPEIRLFFQATSQEKKGAEEALKQIAAGWKDGYAAMLVDLMGLMRPSNYGVRRNDSPFGTRVEDSQLPRLPNPVADPSAMPDLGYDPRPRRSGIRSPEHPSATVRRRLVQFLEKQTSQHFGDDLNRWRKWVWRLPYDPHPDYMLFKGLVYEFIDERLRGFFPPTAHSLIRLDEILWGGVKVNGIPPLDHPDVLAADEAAYLGDDNLVFGIALNGEARAYPKRIIAWHELVRDRIGGLELTIVYCTLCGTVIPYGSVIGGQLTTLGTSGLLYRSNKLMFDERTHSLWSTLTGTPVVGRLAGSKLQLRSYPVVTTTWEEWKTIHPETTVLSLDTGYERDYSEGAAYRDYFATDRLMFEVPETDHRLKNKAEVLVIRANPASPTGGEPKPLAVSADFLEDHPLYHTEFAGHRLVIVTSSRGANRVYEAGELRFTSQPDGTRVEDASGRRWKATEDALVAEDDAGERLPRVPAHRAFWFGWYAQYPETKLIR
ncbi:MAG: DUF3179 domain-containing protein [Acidobacteriota bacterium]